MVFRKNEVTNLVGNLKLLTHKLDINVTNFSSTQVSRYGDKGQRYRWHCDSLGNNGRWVTVVYYVFKELKKFMGGNLHLTNGVILDGEIVKQTPEPRILTIEPENNMAVIFGSKTAHAVETTKSSSKFGDGRFSVNCWIGFK